MTRSTSIPSIAADGGSPGRSGRRAANRIPWRSALSALALLGLVGIGVAAYWSVPPAPFDVAEVAETLPRQPGQDPVPGSHGVAAAIRIGETLLGKPGGFLYNDRLPPGALLDNTPSWECGTLMALRDYTRALRNDFSRSQTQSIENTHVKQADLRFAIDPKSWVLPEAETEYALGSMPSNSTSRTSRRATTRTRSSSPAPTISRPISRWSRNVWEISAYA